MTQGSDVPRALLSPVWTLPSWDLNREKSGVHVGGEGEMGLPFVDALTCALSGRPGHACAGQAPGHRHGAGAQASVRPREGTSGSVSWGS